MSALISLILPYWDRPQATLRALDCLATHYAELDLEVIVVDDGSPVPFRGPSLPLTLRVIRMPDKLAPRNPCVPFNVGVAAATGKYIAISNAEIMHRAPVLQQLLDEVVHGGTMTYATAACWDPEKSRWHAHSSRQPLLADRTEIMMPAGSQYHFLSVMSRELWNLCGGFDEDFRDGAGYDDNDLLMRLGRAGARFVLRDDLVVEHPRAGARAAWTAPMYARNRELFVQKWSPR